MSSPHHIIYSLLQPSEADTAISAASEMGTEENGLPQATQLTQVAKLRPEPSDPAPKSMHLNTVT